MNFFLNATLHSLRVQADPGCSKHSTTPLRTASAEGTCVGLRLACYMCRYISVAACMGLSMTDQACVSYTICDMRRHAGAGVQQLAWHLGMH